MSSFQWSPLQSTVGSGAVDSINSLIGAISIVPGSGIGVTDNGISNITLTNTGVTSFNGLTGDITLAAGSGITLTPVLNTITIEATGGGGGGASTALDNLADVQVNADIIPDSDGSWALGSEGDAWTGVYTALVADTTGISFIQLDNNGIGMATGGGISLQTTSVDNGKDINITTNFPQFPASGSTGNVNITTGGTGSGTASTGNIGIQTGGITTGSAITGGLSISTGNSVDGKSGDIVIETGIPSGSGTRGKIYGDALAFNIPYNDADPATPEEGDLYYNTTDHKAYIYDGTIWRALW